MSDLGFFLGFFLVLVFLVFAVGDDREGVFFDTASSTSAYERSDDGYYAREGEVKGTEDTLSDEEIEERVTAFYRDIDDLKKDVRSAQLREPISPYSSYVSLRKGNVEETDPDREYLTLSTENDAPGSINISDWSIESYVTKKRVGLPQGDRTMDRWRSPSYEDIVLERGESAYIVTGESPVNISFKENLCTGYLADEDDFYPSLSRMCPRPDDELAQFGDTIALDNDRCYEFIESLPLCTMPDPGDYERVNASCERFIEDTFNHNDCVAHHKNEYNFGQDGEWRIYLDRSRELWRKEREIIRLLDAQNRVVSVIEY